MDEYLKILTFLSKHDNGDFIEITHLSDDFNLLYNKTLELKKKELIVIKSAGFFSLAIGGQTTTIGDKENLKKIFAKITLTGHEYLNSKTKKGGIKNIFINSKLTDISLNQSLGSSNSPQTINMADTEKSTIKNKSFMLKVWLLISENKLLSGLILLIIGIILKYLKIV
jgi:hypothetical protein